MIYKVAALCYTASRAETLDGRSGSHTGASLTGGAGLIPLFLPE